MSQSTILKTMLFSLLLLSQSVVAKDASNLSYLNQARQVAENIWIGPQPTEADYSEFAAEEIGAIINTRTAAEMADMSFNSNDKALSYNMSYDLLEIGKNHAYSPAKLTSFNELMEANKGKKMVLHCRSGNRATQLYTAWLIKHQGKTEAEALQAVGSDDTELNDSVKTLLGQCLNSKC